MKEEKNVKKIIQSIVGIILFAIITLMPYASIKNYCIKKRTGLNSSSINQLWCRL